MDTPKWLFNPYGKLRMALGLILLAALLLATNIFEKTQVERLDQSFLSIYQDRLVPATAIFEMRENLYRKRELLKEHLYNGQAASTGHYPDIDSSNRAIKLLLTEYKKTYFLENETSCLLEFESGLEQYNGFESAILDHIRAGDSLLAQQKYEQEAAPYFKTAVLKLSELNHIQSEIGKDMLSQSKETMAGFLLLSDLQKGLLFLFIIVANILMYASRAMVRTRKETFSAN